MIKFEELQRVHIELSSACNASCPACPRNVEGGYTAPNLIIRTINYDDFVKMFDSQTCKQLKYILMCGNFGDPIFCKDLPKILKYLNFQNTELRIKIHTNGGIRSPEWWAELAIAHKNLEVVFSIDGLEDTNHIYRRGVIWKRLMENAQSFIDAGGIAIWEFLIFKHNQHQIDDAKEISKIMRFSRIEFKRAFGFETVTEGYSGMRVLDKNGNLEYHIEPPSKKEYNHNLFEHEKKHRDTTSMPLNIYKNVIDNLNQNFEDINKFQSQKFSHLDGTEISCMTKESKEVYVDSNGNVHPCCFLGNGSQNVSIDFKNIQYHKWLEKNIDLEKTNLKNYSLKEILETNFLNKIEKTWSLSHCNGRLMTCSSMCLKNKNTGENLYI